MVSADPRSSTRRDLSDGVASDGQIGRRERTEGTTSLRSLRPLSSPRDGSIDTVDLGAGAVGRRAGAPVVGGGGAAARRPSAPTAVGGAVSVLDSDEESVGGDEERAAGGPDGLVICAIFGRLSETAGQSLDVSGLWAPRFPSAEMLDSAAALFESVPRWDGHEGPRPRIVIAPGVIALERPDLARRERAAERARHRHDIDVDLIAARLLSGEDDPDPVPSVQITGWSRRSRARMIRRLAELDYVPLFEGGKIPAIVTFTYPGDWEIVVPTGVEAKRHLNAFYRRFARAWGFELICIWKEEFQDRGAPHTHLYMVPPQGLSGAHLLERHEQALREWAPGRPRPRLRQVKFDGLTFPEWLSQTWADIVDHPDPEEKRRHVLAGTGVDYAEGMRASDPRQLAVYFAKHGTYADKEYQHRVPELWQQPGAGPGRFWGYRGLEPVRRQVEIDWDEYLLISRTLRRMARRVQIWDPETKTKVWRRSMRYRTVQRGRRIDYETGEVTYRQLRRVRRPTRRMTSGGAGFVTVSDGAVVASMLARLRETCL